MKKNKIIVKTKSKSYPIYFGHGIIKSTGQLIKNNLPGVKKIFIICDRKLPFFLLSNLRKSLKKYKIKIYKLDSGEKIKNFKIAHALIEDCLKNNLNRSDCIISLGGGVVGDLSAFVSSLVKRGVRFINIPTTLLSQVDASIGGKTAINSNYGKNLIGTFYQPDFVISDISTLITLPKREIICGYGEILKHSLILDRKFFLWLLKNAKQIINKKNKKILEIAVFKSCKIKTKVVGKDEHENSIRKILNFGHTFAHGFEGAKGFSNKLNHGEAVLLGMITAIKLAYKKNLINFKEVLLIKEHYLNLNLPINIRKFFKKNEINKIVYFMKKDKKNFDEKINLILISRIGKTFSIKLNSNYINNFLYSIYDK